MFQDNIEWFWIWLKYNNNIENLTDWEHWCLWNLNDTVDEENFWISLMFKLLTVFSGQFEFLANFCSEKKIRLRIEPEQSGNITIYEEYERHHAVKFGTYDI